MCSLAISPGKPPAALKATPDGPLITPPQPEDEASVAPVTDSTWWNALDHGAPFKCNRSSNHIFISSLRLPATVAVADTLLNRVRWNLPICLYM